MFIGESEQQSPVEAVNRLEVREDVNWKQREYENDLHYRKQRELEQKDSLAMQVLNTPDDAHTTKLKIKASEYILSRF